MRPYTYQEREAKFGKFGYTHSPIPGNPERIVIRGAWVSGNIADIAVPELKLKFGIDKVNVNHMAVDAMINVWAAWAKAGLLPQVHTFNGAWSPRFSRQTGTEAEREAKCAAFAADPNGGIHLSNHAWGTAFDINAREYPLGTPAAPNAPIRQLVAIAEDCGWYWRGNSIERPDPMHFELGNAFVVVQTADIQTALKKHGSLISVDGSLGPKTIAEWVRVCNMLRLNPTINHRLSVHEAEVHATSYSAICGTP